MKQERGLIGQMVGGMIRRSVRARYRRVYLRHPVGLTNPAILYANHHSWMDGYLMFHLVNRLDLIAVDWIEEFDTFPLFKWVGGMRFKRGDGAGRAVVIRETLRLIQEGRSLVLFPEGVLHRPPSLLPFGRTLEFLARKAPQAKLVPVAIYQEQSMHERPEAWMSVGEPHQFESLEDCRSRLEQGLACLKNDVEKPGAFQVLVEGTPDVNERWGRKPK